MDFSDFKIDKFVFENREALVVCPKEKTGKWLLKTEYFGAFPSFEIEMVKRGYHVAHVANITRWNKQPEDTDIKARFADYLSKTYGLHKKCVPVGMSCGGMQGIYFAAKYPEYVSVLYLDAPVINLLSCPAGMGENSSSEMLAEFMEAMQMTRNDLISYRNHPFDNFAPLIENHIPVILVAGDSDKVVPYEENGLLLEKYYKEHGGIIETIIKPCCDHHPHGLEDNTPLIEFVLKYDR